MATRQKTTNYFSHDSSARNDEKIIRLRMKHGPAGYGVYFMILERLREETDYMSVKDYNVIAFDLRVDASLIKSVVEDFGLFVFTDDGKYFYSESFARRMGMKDEIKSRRSEGGKKGMEKRWGKRRDSVDETDVVATAAAVTSDDDNLKRFFHPNNKASIEQLMMNFGMKPEQLPELRAFASEVVNEWKMADRVHDNYTDWCQHLIATMRIKCRDKQSGKGKSKQEKDMPKPTDGDYKFGGGFGGKDV